MTENVRKHYDSASPGLPVAADSQPPPTRRKRKQRSLSPEQKDSGKTPIEHPKKQWSSSSSRSDSYWIWDRAEKSYWDSLSTLCLTSDALRELNRQNAVTKIRIHEEIPDIDSLEHHEDVSHFARHGGPDLSDIRKHPNPTDLSSTPDSKSSRRNRNSKPECDSLVDEDDEAEGSSAYDENFGTHLIQNHIFRSTRLGKAPMNSQDWAEAVKRPRASLSPSRMSDEYEDFDKATEDARSHKGNFVDQVLPKLISKNKYSSARNVKFGNLEPLTQRIIDARPDYYEGHRAGPQNQSIRTQLGTIITPSVKENDPFLPNFFVIVNNNSVCYAVAEMRARYVGALAARGMHRLQCLAGTEAYDGNAYAISANYSGECLYLCTHNLTQPEGPGSLPHTHMVPLRSLSPTDSPKSFCESLTAIRNASDKANEYREQFIQDAILRLKSNTPQN